MNKISLGPKPYTTTMPAVLVGANVGGKPNYMVVAWTGVACMDPPMIAIAINKLRHTEKGILENKTFSVNIPAAKNSLELDYCGMVSGSKIDKSTVFEAFYGKLKTAPLISEFPINIECELRHTLELGSHTLFIGEVVQVHMDERVTDARGRVTLNKAKPIVYCPVVHEYRALGKKLGTYGFSEGKRED